MHAHRPIRCVHGPDVAAAADGDALVVAVHARPVLAARALRPHVRPHLQYSTVQYSTVQYSTVQYRTVVLTCRWLSLSRHHTVLGPTEMDLMGADCTFAQLSPILAFPTDPPRYHSVLS